MTRVVRSASLPSQVAAAIALSDCKICARRAERLQICCNHLPGRDLPTTMMVRDAIGYFTYLGSRVLLQCHNGRSCVRGYPENAPGRTGNRQGSGSSFSPPSYGPVDASAGDNVLLRE